MIPEIGKIYKIDYWFQTDNPEDKDLFYNGIGTYLGETEETENSTEILYLFQVPDNVLTAWFSEEDIIEEICL